MQEALRQISTFSSGSSSERLTKHIRLEVYSYLNLETLIRKASLLNKAERTNLRNSYIAREKKDLRLTLSEQLWPHCPFHGNVLQ